MAHRMMQVQVDMQGKRVELNAKQCALLDCDANASKMLLTSVLPFPMGHPQPGLGPMQASLYGPEQARNSVQNKSTQ